MVERDIKKDFLNDLARLQFDVFLIDLIDERFNLYLEPEGKICTLSSELLSVGFPKDSNRGSKICSGSEEFWHLWEAGWSTLLSQLRHFGVLDRLRVNQVFWSSRTENGGNFEPDYSDRQVDLANQSLERMYRHISADIPSRQFLRFNYGLMTGSITHKWGISPFHYIDAYYHAAIQQLCGWPLLRNRTAISEKAMTSRTNYPVDRVILRHEGDQLVATAVFEASQIGQISFYVFRNGKQIHTQGYSQGSIVRVGVKPEPGVYRALVFFLTQDGRRVTVYSNPVFLYPVISTLAG
jgi:hypothetical protein